MYAPPGAAWRRPPPGGRGGDSATESASSRTAGRSSGYARSPAFGGAVRLAALVAPSGVPGRLGRRAEEMVPRGVEVPAVMEAASWPGPAADWRTSLREHARANTPAQTHLREHAWAAFRLLDRHSGMAARIGSLRVASPAYGEVSHRAVTALLDLGFAPADAILAHDLVHEAGPDVLHPVSGPVRPPRARRRPRPCATTLPDALPDGDARPHDALIENRHRPAGRLVHPETRRDPGRPPPSGLAGPEPVDDHWQVPAPPGRGGDRGVDAGREHGVSHSARAVADCRMQLPVLGVCDVLRGVAWSGTVPTYLPHDDFAGGRELVHAGSSIYAMATALCGGET